MYADENTSIILDIFHSFNSKYIIKEPTRIINRSTTVMDNIFFINKEKYSAWENNPLLPDHFGLELSGN